MNTHLQTLIERGQRAYPFGVSYVQRCCKIGYNLAMSVIEEGLESGVIFRDPNCEYKYFFKK